VRANIGADIESHVARAQQAAIGPDGAGLEAAQQPDGKIDALAQIELPIDAAAPHRGRMA
jgi:hypothetical protein